MRIVVALGGNALLHRGESPEAGTQTRRLADVAPALAALASQHELVIVHGNGPQVGLLADENASDTAIARAYPLGDMVAESQGLIGLWIQQAVHNAGATKPTVAVVSQTVVNAADPAWLTPTKFIGPGYEEAEAHTLERSCDWSFAQDGVTWRRVVGSPEPLEIVELAIVERLLSSGTTVIVGGGGGVPVQKEPAGLRTVDAVIDKDSVAALLAIRLSADLLVILTDVPAVMVEFGTDHQHPIGATTVDALAQHDFADGSMGPKVSAALKFSRATGRRSAIGSLDEAQAVVRGDSGTQIGSSTEMTSNSGATA